MKIKDWIESVSRSGMVCTDYMRKISAVETREDMFRVLCDANGGSWLFDIHAKGVPLPIEDFCKEFANYLNGKRLMEYPQGYTSKFYCRPTEVDIDADTTLIYFLECMDMEVYVPKNKYPSIILSAKSTADVVLGDGARVNIELYGDARVNLVGDQSRVRITKH
jgi:hypothetical protein